MSYLSFDAKVDYVQQSENFIVSLRLHVNRYCVDPNIDFCSWNIKSVVDVWRVYLFIDWMKSKNINFSSSFHSIVNLYNVIKNIYSKPLTVLIDFIWN